MGEGTSLCPGWCVNRRVDATIATALEIYSHGRRRSQPPMAISRKTSSEPTANPRKAPAIRTRSSQRITVKIRRTRPTPSPPAATQVPVEMWKVPVAPGSAIEPLKKGGAGTNLPHLRTVVEVLRHRGRLAIPIRHRASTSGSRTRPSEPSRPGCGALLGTPFLRRTPADTRGCPWPLLRTNGRRSSQTRRLSACTC